MSQIFRIYNTEIANGNLIDATHLSGEFNQLVTESNSQDTRLGTVETSVTGITGALRGHFSGLMVEYFNTTKVSIKVGACRDSGNTEWIEVTGTFQVDLTTSGANGLDTGSRAANTWYYLWMIKNPSNGTVAALFSTSSASPTMPTGFTKKRMMPIAIKTDGSSNILRFLVSDGWPMRPLIRYHVNYTDSVVPPNLGTTNVLSNGTATSYTTVSLSSFVPVISREAELNVTMHNGPATFYVTEDETLNTGAHVGGSGGSLYGLRFRLPVSNAQSVRYKRLSASNGLYMDVAGYIVTEWS